MPVAPPPAPLRLGFGRRLVILILAQGLAVAAIAALTAWLRASPWIVLAAGTAAAILLTALLAERVLGSARRTVMALTDGVRSFRDGDLSLRLAATRDDELGDLVGLYNEMGDA